MKWTNLVGFLISLSSFLFWNDINVYFNGLSNIYSIDSGQYIIFYLGALIAFYGIKEPIIQLFAVLLSYRLFDELSGDDGTVNIFDYFETLCIFVLSIYNFKNIK